MKRKDTATTLQGTRQRTLATWALLLGLVALILLGIALVPKFILDNGERLLWQLESWAMIIGTLLIAVDVVILTNYYARGKHVLKKIFAVLGCVVLVFACLIGLYCALVKHDNKVWGGNGYVVYSEYYDLFDPGMFVLYKRDGLIDRRMYTLCHVYYGTVKKVDYTMYPDADLIKEEADRTDFDGFNDYHTTTFFRLSDGHYIDEEKNDSLLSVVNR
ncbi:MAG: hypothetical protein K6E93_03740 [Bacteroidales bacterium]|nr:hypothetical protein [Bacteroidales bacterium]